MNSRTIFAMAVTASLILIPLCLLDLPATNPAHAEEVIPGTNKDLVSVDCGCKGGPICKASSVQFPQDYMREADVWRQAEIKCKAADDCPVEGKMVAGKQIRCEASVVKVLPAFKDVDIDDCKAKYDAYKAVGSCARCEGVTDRGALESNRDCHQRELELRKPYLDKKCDYIAWDSRKKGSQEAESEHWARYAVVQGYLEVCEKALATP